MVGWNSALDAMARRPAETAFLVLAFLLYVVMLALVVGQASDASDD